MHAPHPRTLVLAAVLAVALAGCSRRAEPPAGGAPDTTAAAPTPAVPDPAGAWVTDTMPAADAAGRIVTLTLDASGGARIVTLYAGRGTAPADSGRWTVAGDSLAIRWLLRTGRALKDPMVWRVAGDTLVPLAWDRAALGADGLSFHRVPALP